ncbi:DUF421 domain-containing protein [Kiritimatiellaeota bacterium B1221]|nr:DUF421 domain-containing protein [Kiritimatiellaeota bacterium B1221]
MFISESPSVDLILRSILLPTFTMIWVVAVVKGIGLRSFSKMTAFDFISTIASGSLLASAARAQSWTSFLQPTLAILSILGFQTVLAISRQRNRALEQHLLNQPVVLYKDGEFQRQVMEENRVTENDLWSKIREANLVHPKEIKAIVLETTGSVSVLHGENFDPVVLTGVNQQPLQN